MQHLRILLDLDGTVAQNAGRRVAARQFGVSLPENDSRPLADLLGLSEEAFWTWWHENQHEIYDQADPLPGAPETLRSLKESGAYIAVVTARRTDAQAVTEAWLRRVGIAVDEVVMAADDKVAPARALNLNLGFEDDPHFAVPLADAFPMILIENRKNRDFTLEHAGIHRVRSWDEVLPLVRRLGTRIA